MNLFRSEEHARNWSGWDPQWAEQLQPLSHWLERFAGERMRNRGRPDYVSWRTSLPDWAERPRPPARTERGGSSA